MSVFNFHTWKSIFYNRAKSTKKVGPIDRNFADKCGISNCRMIGQWGHHGSKRVRVEVSWDPGQNGDKQPRCTSQSDRTKWAHKTKHNTHHHRGPHLPSPCDLSNNHLYLSSSPNSALWSLLSPLQQVSQSPFFESKWFLLGWGSIITEEIRDGRIIISTFKPHNYKVWVFSFYLSLFHFPNFMPCLFFYLFKIHKRWCLFVLTLEHNSSSKYPFEYRIIDHRFDPKLCKILTYACSKFDLGNKLMIMVLIFPLKTWNWLILWRFHAFLSYKLL